MAKKKGQITYLAQSLDIFLKSWKNAIKTMPFIFVIDAILLSALIYAAKYFLKALEGIASGLQGFDVNKIWETQDVGLADALSARMDSLLLSFKIYGVIYLVIFLVLSAIAAYFVWFKISQKKRSWKSFFKFFALHSILMLFFVTLYLSFAGRVETGASLAPFFTFIIAFFFVTNTLYAGFAKDGLLVGAFKRLFVILKKIYLLILPLIAALIVLVLLQIALGPTSMMRYGVAIFFGAMILYFAWLRTYYYLILDGVA